jgi:hypothetical protein
MDGTLSLEEVAALARAIEAAEERGDGREAIRLSSLPWAQVHHWLDALGYAHVGDPAEHESRRDGPAG